MKRSAAALLAPLFFCAVSAAIHAQQIPGCPVQKSSKDRPLVHIDRIDFESDSISDAARQDLLSVLRRKYFGDDWSHQLQDLVRDAWQGQGYFTVVVAVDGGSLERDTAGKTSVRVRVTEGPQYRVGEIHVHNAAPGDSAAALYSPAQLRDQIPLHTDDLLSTPKIRQGIEALNRLYATQGYLDLDVTVTTKTDPERHTADVTLDIDPHAPYRLGNVKTLGADSTTENLIRSVLTPGEAFNLAAFRDFLKDKQDQLPADIQDRLQVHRNSADLTVDLTIDLRPCPSITP